MCYSGQCKYENHMGDCTKHGPRPGDAKCIIEDTEIGAHQESSRILAFGVQKYMGHMICKGIPPEGHHGEYYLFEILKRHIPLIYLESRWAYLYDRNLQQTTDSNMSVAMTNSMKGDFLTYCRAVAMASRWANNQPEPQRRRRR